MRRRSKTSDARGSVVRGAALAAATLAAALGTACVARQGAWAPAGAAEAVRAAAAWDAYASRQVARGAAELDYDVEVSRRGFALDGTLMVRDDPGRALTAAASGPFGLGAVHAEWDGETVTVTSGRKRQSRQASDEEFGRAFGIPLSPAEISLLLYGVADTAAPERVARDGTRWRYLWHGGAKWCDFDLRESVPLAVGSRDGAREVRVAYRRWTDGLPSEIGVKVSTGGSATLTLQDVRSIAR